MKKVIKIISLVLLSIIGAYSVFVIEESIRLSKDVDARPLIINDVQMGDHNSGHGMCTYHSIGFKLINKYSEIHVDEEDEENVESFIIGQEFWLFDTFMLWGWIS